MSKDLNYGTRDEKGNWKPSKIEISPTIINYFYPFKPLKILNYFIGYPMRLIWLIIILISWFFFTPSYEVVKNINFEWIFKIFVRNFFIILIFYGLYHLHYYKLKRQGNSFKYNIKFFEKDNSKFLFKNQLKDNLFWVFISALPIWTFYEVLTLWVFANNYVYFLTWNLYPVYLTIFFFLVPFIFDIHFYLMHRLLHFKILYKFAHNIHHRNINPNPWSGLSMHPFEHLLYFSGVLIHFVIPSHPFIAVWHLYYTALAPAAGHSGFDKLELNNKIIINNGDYFHYLHHKYFECNYSSGGANFIDKFFGTFHDGYKESLANIMKNKRKKT